MIPHAAAANATPGQTPTIAARITVAVVIACLAALLAHASPQEIGESAGDFGQIWYSAVALLQGTDPYQVIGPGRTFQHEFPFLYPLTASLAVLPLGLVEERYAGIIFVFVTSALLSFAVTRESWHRLPMFLSIPFVAAAQRVQWAPLLTAGVCLPGLAWAFVLKPNIGLALFASAPSKEVVKIAAIGGTIVIAGSLLVLPGWPLEWFNAIQSAEHTRPPITRPGGFLVLATLVRWRRWDARLILALALVPQTLAWYDVLPLLLIAQTLRQSLVLSLLTCCGFACQIIFGWPLGTLLIAFAYVPATMLVLRRRNEGWLVLPGLWRRQPDRPLP